jgi:hypothetical protein
MHANVYARMVYARGCWHVTVGIKVKVNDGYVKVNDDYVRGNDGYVKVNDGYV